MNISFQWQSPFLDPIIALLCVSIGFIGYYFISHNPQSKQKFDAQYPPQEAAVRWVLFQRMMGVLFFGLIPLLIVLIALPHSLANYGIALPKSWETLAWIGGLSSLIILVNSFAAKNPKNLEAYPQMRTKQWNSKMVWQNALSWMAYLLAYEFVFRGILLFLCLETMGVWPAIAVNVSIYALVHVPKGAKETLGAIPLGLILCVLTLRTETIWIAYWVHVAMALSNAYFAIQAYREER